jgi:glucose-1-phosphate thymidylyltransferase
MRAIIPVAGVGSRLRPHTYTVPKVLLNVAGKPIIGHILDNILDAGITKATIIIGYLGESVKEYVNQSYPSLDVEFIEQEERLGLGHAIYISRNTFNSDPLLIILGDTIFDVNLKRMIQSSFTEIGVKQVDDPRRFGVAETVDGFIKRLIEKPEHPTSNLALVGLYFIKHPLLLVESLDKIMKNDIRTKGEYQLTDALQMMIDNGEQMRTFTIEGWYDCGKPETLLSTNRYLLTKQAQEVRCEGCVIQTPIFVAPTAQVSNSILGPGVTIGERAVVTNSIIRNSIVSEGAVVEDALIEDSIVGSNAVVRGAYKHVNIGDSSELEFT